jgi:hypothetical protein
MEQQRIRWWIDLDEGKVEKIITRARKFNLNLESTKKMETEIHYLEKNKERMRLCPVSCPRLIRWLWCH